MAAAAAMAVALMEHAPVTPVGLQVIVLHLFIRPLRQRRSDLTHRTPTSLRFVQVIAVVMAVVNRELVFATLTTTVLVVSCVSVVSTATLAA